MRTRILLVCAALLLACSDDNGPTTDASGPATDAPPADTVVPDMTPAGDTGPISCNYMGTIYPDGAEFPAADGCNMCKCNPGGIPGKWGCSAKLCVDGGAGDASDGPISCNYMGTIYPDGAEFPAADGCNMCKCNPGGTPGKWGCSLKACQDAGGDGGDAPAGS